MADHQGKGGHIAPVGPAPNSYSRRVYKGHLGQVLCPLDLIDGLQLAQVGIGGMLEVTTSSTRTPVVNTGDKVALCRQVLVPKVS